MQSGGRFYLLKLFATDPLTRPPALTHITYLQNCGSHGKPRALCVCFVLCKMGCVIRELILIFSDRISCCHCNANTLQETNVPSVLSVIPGVIYQFIHELQ